MAIRAWSPGISLINLTDARHSQRR